jgi:regulatory protein YycI of two-component signal transduction system YycFG
MGNKVNHTQTVSCIEIQINLKSQSFPQLLIEAMDQTFSKLGVPTKHALYSFLETNYKLSKEDIPNRIEDFVNALEQIFGTSALLIEIDLMKSMQQKVPSFIFKIENADLNFEYYLKSLKSFTETL